MDCAVVIAAIAPSPRRLDIAWSIYALTCITPRLMAERTMLRLVAESATPPQPTT